MEIFLFSRFIASLPGAFLFFVGEPFKYHSESQIPSHWSKKDLRDNYDKEKWKHYGPRVALTCAALVGLTFFFMLFLLAPEVVIPILFALSIIIGLVDGVRIAGRAVFYHKMQEIALEEGEGGQALVVEGYWKDTSLNTLMKQRAEDKAKRAELIREAKAKGESSISYKGESVSHYEAEWKRA